MASPGPSGNGQPDSDAVQARASMVSAAAAMLRQHVLHAIRLTAAILGHEVPTELNLPNTHHQIHHVARPVSGGGAHRRIASVDCPAVWRCLPGCATLPDGLRLPCPPTVVSRSNDCATLADAVLGVPSAALALAARAAVGSLRASAPDSGPDGLDESAAGIEAGAADADAQAGAAGARRSTANEASAPRFYVPLEDAATPPEPAPGVLVGDPASRRRGLDIWAPAHGALPGGGLPCLYNKLGAVAQGASLERRAAEAEGADRSPDADADDEEDTPGSGSPDRPTAAQPAGSASSSASVAAGAASGSSKSRRDRGLNVVCENFLAYCASGGVDVVVLDKIADKLDIQRRRIYDLVNIFEAVGITTRKERNKYFWHGTSMLPLVLERLKARALADPNVCPPGEGPDPGPREPLAVGTMESTQLRKAGAVVCFGVPAGEPESERGWRSPSKAASPLRGGRAPKREREAEPAKPLAAKDPNAQDDAVSSLSGTGGEKSMGAQAQRLVMLFLAGRPVVCLEHAAAIMMGEEASKDARRLKTKVRRLYDIANVLQSLGLVHKVSLATLPTRKAAFAWRGVGSVPLLPGLRPSVTAAGQAASSSSVASSAKEGAGSATGASLAAHGPAGIRTGYGYGSSAAGPRRRTQRRRTARVAGGASAGRGAFADEDDDEDEDGDDISVGSTRGRHQLPGSSANRRFPSPVRRSVLAELSPSDHLSHLDHDPPRDSGRSHPHGHVADEAVDLEMLGLAAQGDAVNAAAPRQSVSRTAAGSTHQSAVWGDDLIPGDNPAGMGTEGFPFPSAFLGEDADSDADPALDVDDMDVATPNLRQPNQARWDSDADRFPALLLGVDDASPSPARASRRSAVRRAANPAFHPNTTPAGNRVGFATVAADAGRIPSSSSASSARQQLRARHAPSATRGVRETSLGDSSAVAAASAGGASPTGPAIALLDLATASSSKRRLDLSSPGHASAARGMRGSSRDRSAAPSTSTGGRAGRRGGAPASPDRLVDSQLTLSRATVASEARSGARSRRCSEGAEEDGLAASGLSLHRAMAEPDSGRGADSDFPGLARREGAGAGRDGRERAGGEFVAWLRPSEMRVATDGRGGALGVVALGGTLEERQPGGEDGTFAPSEGITSSSDIDHSAGSGRGASEGDGIFDLHTPTRDSVAGAPFGELTRKHTTAKRYEPGCRRSAGRGLASSADRPARSPRGGSSDVDGVSSDGDDFDALGLGLLDFSDTAI
ncbi:hypothetical protein FNF31_07283 [Cafeteria roenbergensis]|uniref:E2F/DP family winged-helix DNA-binding domain-containing protein n=1 Tax=Cafeteria roenbergensis TaxID=33653 RepID=A0A5A8C930_CAFRO|nr:hypothetical protein FNF31_07283 [Cafeteria roenbergensis]